MYSRLEHVRSRSAENIAPRHIPMSATSDPNRSHSYNRASYLESGSYGDLSQDRYPQYEDSHQNSAFEPEDHQQAYYHEPYQTTPQDIPLLSRNVTQEPLYDPSEDHPPYIQYRDPPESFQLDPKATSMVAGTGEAQPIKRKKNIKLFRGNLVLDCPVPPKLLKNIPHTPPPGRDEFTHTRYTAATCDPSEFFNQRFTLRQPLFSQPRNTELLIVVTMYNENDALFARTMAGIFENIEYMCSGKGKHGGSWGKDGWKKIVVCVVSDGRAKINSRTAAVLTTLGVYQCDISQHNLGDKKVMAHIYEYTTRVGIEVNNDGIVETKPGIGCPVQMIFCLKEENQKKINSHRWAFQAFGEVLRPNICVLLDAGTRPGKDSIYQLWHAFEVDDKCGGACGEIKAMLGKRKKNLLNPLVATQNFEYKMSNILDKPMESAFGFISVLPGAFSAYRFIALQNDKHDDGPLQKYFAGEKMLDNAGIFAKNMYLAEDRILCFELVTKRNAKWVLTYVKDAKGETDVPETMSELIKQRRRWLNGSFFAAVYALTHFYQIFRSSHTSVRKAFFLVEFSYQLINMVFSWFAIGNFFLVFQILTTSLGAPELLGNTGEVLSVIIEWIYLGSLVTCFVLALGNRPDGSKRFYMVMVFTWGGIMLYLIFASLFIAFKSVAVELADEEFTFSKLFSNSVFFTLIVSLLSTYILWIFVSVLFMDPWHIVTSSIQYLLLSPTYTNVMNVYAFCNIQDVTWGTKGEDKAAKLDSPTVTSDGNVDVDLPFDSDLDALYDSELQKFSTLDTKEKSKPSTSDEQEDYYKGFRSYVVLIWMFCNAALVAIVLKAGGLNRLSVQPQPSNEGDPSATVKIYLQVVLWSVACLSGFKFVGAMWYLIIKFFRG